MKDANVGPAVATPTKVLKGTKSAELPVNGIAGAHSLICINLCLA
jgi:hypothetical protein